MIGCMADDVKQLIFEICQKHHWYIVRMESDKDHLHILLQYNPTDSITKIATVLKSYSTFHIWKRYRSILAKHFWKENTFWSDGYFAASVGNASKTTIERYIQNQG